MPTPLEKYENYLLNNPVGQRIIEVVEISHSAFENTFYLVKEPSGVTVTLETGDVVDCMGVNIDIERADSDENLDEKFSFNISDVEGVIQDQAELIPIDSDEAVKVIYRIYMSDELTSPAVGPVTLQGVSLNFTVGRATIEAEAPTLVTNRTGELYTYDRFPALRAFL